MSPQESQKDKPKPGANYKKLSRAKMDELRAKGKCFNCKEKGHEQRNCPKLSSMKPLKTAINAGSVRFAKLEQLAEKKNRADTYVGSMSIIGRDPVMDILREVEELKLRVHRMCETAWGEDPLWYIEETRPDCKYSIEVNDEEITVWDFVNGRSRMFTRDKLNNPDFDIAVIFDGPEPDRTPTSVREGGYPDLGDYNRWDWPAINWMRARLNSQLNFVDEGNAPKDVCHRHGRLYDYRSTLFLYFAKSNSSLTLVDLTSLLILSIHVTLILSYPYTFTFILTHPLSFSQMRWFIL